MAFAHSIHPLTPPRLRVPDGWVAPRGSGAIALPGGAFLQIEQWNPMGLQVPAGVDVFAVLAQAEDASGCWLEYEGRWNATPDGRRRAVRLADKQPDVRLTFAPDAGPEQHWLLLVDSGDVPGDLVSWTHDEWDSERHQNGGKWTMRNSQWFHAGRFTPDNAPGVLTAQGLTLPFGDA